jgi:ribosomal protein S18
VVGTVLAFVVLESLLLLNDRKSRLRTIEDLRDLLEPKERSSVRIMASNPPVSSHSASGLRVEEVDADDGDAEGTDVDKVVLPRESVKCDGVDVLVLRRYISARRRPPMTSLTKNRAHETKKLNRAIPLARSEKGRISKGYPRVRPVNAIS